MQLQFQSNKNKMMERHIFVSNFDSGILAIFLPLLSWSISKNMLLLALMYVIPYFIDTVVDHKFSVIADKVDRKKLMIIGNVVSGFSICCIGMFDSTIAILIFITIESIFSKLYTVAMDAVIRSTVPKEKYLDYNSSLNLVSTYGASFGGQLFMILFVVTASFQVIFILAGVVEIFSTVYLFGLDSSINKDQDRRNLSNQGMLKSFMHTIKFPEMKILLLFYIGYAMFSSRMMLFSYDYYNVATEHMGAIFFVVYAISTFAFHKVKGKIQSYRLEYFIPISLLIVGSLTFVVIFVTNIYLFIILWFAIEFFVLSINMIIDEVYNARGDSNLGLHSFGYRIAITIGIIAGTLITSYIVDYISFTGSFIFSTVMVMITAIVASLVLRNNEYKKDSVLAEDDR